MIREHTSKDAAPLDTFLSLVCPHIGILSREEYLPMMGWIMGEASDKEKMQRQFLPEISSFPEHILSTNLSAEQVVAYCYHAKYIADGKDDIPSAPTNVATLTMAAQPPGTLSQINSQILRCADSQQPRLNTDDIGRIQQAALVADAIYDVSDHQTDAHLSGVVSMQPSVDYLDWFRTSASTVTATASPVRSMRNDQLSPVQQMSPMTQRVQSALALNNNGANGPSAPLRQTVHEVQQTGSQYPFAGQFDPYNVDPVVFNPFVGDADLAFSISSSGTYLAPNDMENPEDFDFSKFLSDDYAGL